MMLPFSDHEVTVVLTETRGRGLLKQMITEHVFVAKSSFGRHLTECKDLSHAWFQVTIFLLKCTKYVGRWISLHINMQQTVKDM